MARIARVVIPGLPHHITQRGNRRQQTFFNDGDYAAYMELMAEWCRDQRVEIWSYCLMPNHTHIIAVPSSEEGLRWAIGEAHRRYTRRINFREKWRGYLWQGRFASFVMDEAYLLAAARYVELNPVAHDWCRSPAIGRGAAQGAFGWHGRPVGQSRSPAGNDPRLGRLSRRAPSRKRNSAAFVVTHARVGHWATRHFCTIGRHDWPCPETAKTRSEAETNELSHVSPEFSSDPADRRLRREKGISPIVTSEHAFGQGEREVRIISRH